MKTWWQRRAIVATPGCADCMGPCKVRAPSITGTYDYVLKRKHCMGVLGIRALNGGIGHPGPM